MFGLKKRMDQLVMANSVCWSCVEGGHGRVDGGQGRVEGGHGHVEVEDEGRVHQ